MYVQTLCTEVVVVWCLHHSTAAAVQLELKKGNSNIPLLLGRDLRNSTGSLINNISSYLTYDLYICTPTDWHGKTHGPSACRTMTYGGGRVQNSLLFPDSGRSTLADTFLQITISPQVSQRDLTFYIKGRKLCSEFLLIVWCVVFYWQLSCKKCKPVRAAQLNLNSFKYIHFPHTSNSYLWL